MRFLALIAVVLVVHDNYAVFGLENGLIRTPPMGWSTWNRFHCGINETLVKEMAMAMVKSGMSKVGYEFVNLDDCWLAAERNSSGYLQADPKAFPSGMKALGDFIHAQGLKYGLYGDPGPKTCAGRAGNQGHEAIDGKTYAEFGADYLKYDACGATETYQLHGYQDMRDALLNSGRPIAYSICPDSARCNDVTQVMWDASSVANVNMCRGDRLCHKILSGLGDIEPTWHSWTCILDANVIFDSMRYSGPGHFIMPDMLEVGNGMTTDEDMSHFSLWAMIAAPLIAGNDLRSMSNTTLSILTNTEVIAVNQDPMGKAGQRVFKSPDNTSEVWSRQLYDGTYAVVLFNRDDNSKRNITLLWRYVGLPSDHPAHLRDLWKHADLGVFTSQYVTSVPSHGVVMLRVNQTRGGMIAPGDLSLLPCASETDQLHIRQASEYSAADNTIRIGGMCVDVYDCQTTKPNNVQLYQCHPGQPGCGSRNQEWSLSANGTITSALEPGRLCLSVAQSTADFHGQSSSAVETKQCNGSASQAWDFSAGVLRSRAQNKCLTASSGIYN